MRPASYKLLEEDQSIYGWQMMKEVNRICVLAVKGLLGPN